MSVTLHVVLIALCLCCAAFFAGMETGVVALNRLRLRHMVRRKTPGAAILQNFLQYPEWLLSTTLVGTNLCHVAHSVLAVSLWVNFLGPARGATAGGVSATLLILIFAEYLPKAWFQSYPSRRTLPLAPLLRLAYRMFLPVSWMLVRLMRILIPLPNQDAAARTQPLVTREELIHLAGEGEKSGALTPQEHRMIRGVVELRGKTCRDIMVPRGGMACLFHDMTVARALDVARDKGYMRYPVWHREKNKFVGVVHIMDLLRDPEADRRALADFVRPPQFCADYTLVDHVLPRMRVTRQPLMLVTDPRFEVVGLVTLRDVLDEIVGNL